MRLVFLLATLGFTIAPIGRVAAQSPSTQTQGSQSGQTGPQQTGQPGTAPSGQAGQPATPPPPQSPSPNAPPPPAARPETTTETAPLGNAPSVPAGESP